MFGDDPDPTVATTRVGSAEVSDAHARGRCTVQRDSGLGKRENEEQGWSRNGQRKQGGTRQLRADASFKNNDGNECRCNADDAMMKCNKQINTHDDNEKQGRRLERRSWGVTSHNPKL